MSFETVVMKRIRIAFCLYLGCDTHMKPVQLPIRLSSLSSHCYNVNPHRLTSTNHSAIITIEKHDIFIETNTHTHTHTQSGEIGERTRGNVNETEKANEAIVYIFHNFTRTHFFPRSNSVSIQLVFHFLLETNWIQ